MIYQRDEREVLQSPKVQGASEARAYSFDFSASGVTTIEDEPSVLIFDVSANPPEDVSDDKLSSADASAEGTVVTMSGKVQELLAGKEYRLHCRVTHDGGQQSELFCRIFGRL